MIIALTEKSPLPSLEATEILAAAAGIEKARLPLLGRDQVGRDVQAKAEALLARRLNDEPLAYILGEWDFYGLTFVVTPDVLIPRIDTELLARLAIEKAPPNAKILDLCCGSGCLGLAIKHYRSDAAVTLADISSKALDVAKQNAARLGLAADFLPCDMLAMQSVDFDKYDLVVCNPPYIKSSEIASLDTTVCEHEPSLALDGGEDGLVFYRALSDYWAVANVVSGTLPHLLMEVGECQAAAVAAMFEGYATRTHLDTQGIERVVEVFCS